MEELERVEVTVEEVDDILSCEDWFGIFVEREGCVVDVLVVEVVFVLVDGRRCCCCCLKLL